MNARLIPALLVLTCLGACRADGARPLFERENEEVSEGNAHMRARRFAEALAAYERAAARHPSSPEVALDRGLALLALERFADARDAFIRATGEHSEKGLRADALYDLGLSHHREAEKFAEADDHEHAQQSFRDAVEAYRRSLRTVPGVEHVAINLEIALRRLSEEQEEERQEQEQQDQQQQQQDQEQQDQQQQDQQQDQQQQDQQQQDQQQQDQEQQDQQQQDQQQQDQQQQDQQQQDQQQQDQQQQDQARQQPSPRPEQERTAEAREATASDDAAESLSPEMRAMLEALERSEGSLEEERARQRARVERRRPAQDW